jgi:small-conductance mechanosensitive channel
MDIATVKSSFQEVMGHIELALTDPQTYTQLAVIAVVYLLSFIASSQLKKRVPLLASYPKEGAHPIKITLYKMGTLLFPLLALVGLFITSSFISSMLFAPWLIHSAKAIAVILFFISLINTFVASSSSSAAFKWIGLPILFLHLVGLLPSVIAALEQVSLSVGNISFSAYGVIRVFIFGWFLFWLGRSSNQYGQAVIKRQHKLDVPTREIFSKLFEVALICIIALLLLNVMGINLTALAVFGGALGVGLGLGLQTIASNFISGIIILLDKSLTIGDYVELDDGQKGFVREFRMRYTVLETYDGKDILVPNEKFISASMINWTHKDPKQRYRVDFSVAYATDIRAMVELVKEVVATHPQVISGDDIPFEERPDCEIDSFGDSGVNMFVEFWMEGIDDGKNRVGGDLLLLIFETLRENDISIPFPQREVRIVQ